MALSLTEDQLAELRESFSIFDKNGDGTITPGELINMMQSMNKAVTQKKVKTMIETMDTDGNGKIDFDEFCSHCRTVRKTEKDLDKAFQEFDLDGNGFITESELFKVMSKLGQALDMDHVKQMIGAADRDGDGRVNYTEFLRLMTKK